MEGQFQLLATGTKWVQQTKNRIPRHLEVLFDYHLIQVHHLNPFQHQKQKKQKQTNQTPGYLFLSFFKGFFKIMFI